MNDWKYPALDHQEKTSESTKQLIDSYTEISNKSNAFPRKSHFFQKYP
jgi:hypothetical protein